MEINSSNINSKIGDIFYSRYQENSPGGALLIAKGDSIIFEGYKGVANYATGESISSETRFNIASISKQFTATSILLLHERLKLDIKDPIIKYFPDLDKDIFSGITLVHLMSHSSGIPDERPRNDRNWMLHATDEESIGYLSQVDKLHFAPGTEYEYINPTFQILYAIIQDLTNGSFVEFQQKEIFDVAEMRNTFYFDANKKHSNVAHGYIAESIEKSSDRDSSVPSSFRTMGIEDKKGNKWHEYDYGEETFFATKADGGIYSTPQDLLKWHRALKTDKILNSKMRKESYKVHTKVSGSTLCEYQNRPYTGYGLGYFIDNTPNYPIKVYHTGDNGGFQAYLAYYPEADISIILLENRNDLNRWQFVKLIDGLLRDKGLL